MSGVGAILRILSQPAHGTVGLSGSTATYFPEPGFVGNDTFTFGAYDGQKNSAPGTATVTVGQGPFSFGVSALVPPSYPAGWPVAFAAYASVTNSVAQVSYSWDFGDGTPPDTAQFAKHAYAEIAAGPYTWTLISTLSGKSLTNSGTVLIGNGMRLSESVNGSTLALSWLASTADAMLETTAELGSAAQWRWVTNAPVTGLNTLSVSVPVAGRQFYRLRRVW